MTARGHSRSGAPHNRGVEGATEGARGPGWPRSARPCPPGRALSSASAGVRPAVSGAAVVARLAARPLSTRCRCAGEPDSVHVPRPPRCGIPSELPAHWLRARLRVRHRRGRVVTAPGRHLRASCRARRSARLGSSHGEDACRPRRQELAPVAANFRLRRASAAGHARDGAILPSVTSGAMCRVDTPGVLDNS